MQLAGAGIGVVGVALIVDIESLQDVGREVAAQAAVLGGAVLYAGAALHGRRRGHLPAPVTAAGTMIWACIWLIPACLIIDRPWTLAPSPGAMLAAVMLGLFCTGIALLIYFRLLRTLGSMAVASQSYLRVGVGLALGALILGETITTTDATGALAIILGVVLINRKAR